MACPSGMSRRTWTPPRSVFAQSGRMAETPVAISSLSYGSTVLRPES